MSLRMLLRDDEEENIVAWIGLTMWGFVLLGIVCVLCRVLH